MLAAFYRDDVYFTSSKCTGTYRMTNAPRTETIPNIRAAISAHVKRDVTLDTFYNTSQTAERVSPKAHCKAANEIGKLITSLKIIGKVKHCQD